MPYIVDANLNEMSERKLDMFDTHLKSGQYYPHINGSYNEDGLYEEILVDVDRRRVVYLSYRNRHKTAFQSF